MENAPVEPIYLQFAQSPLKSPERGGDDHSPLSPNKIPTWKLKQIELGRLAKEREEKEKEERLKKIEEIKMRHLQTSGPKPVGGTPQPSTRTQRSATLTHGLQRTVSVGAGVSSRAGFALRKEGPSSVSPQVKGGLVSKSRGSAVINKAVDDIEIRSPRSNTVDSEESGKVDNKEGPMNNQMKQMEEEINRMRRLKEEIENKHTATVRNLESDIVQQKTKQEEMHEELARLRDMKDEIELQHLAYQKRLEQKIQEEMTQKLAIEEELNRTRQRLVEELESIQQAKAQLSAEIDSLKTETEKKRVVEEELEKVRNTKEKLDLEIEKLKGEAERRGVIEAELETIREAKETLEKEMASMKEETNKKSDLEDELEKVKDTREKLISEIDKLKAEAQRREHIEREMDNIKNTKEELDAEIATLKEESERRRELEEKLYKLQESHVGYLREITLLQKEAERRQKLETELILLKETKENLQSEIEALRRESEKKTLLEAELERLKDASSNLNKEVAQLQVETEKRKAIEIELEKVRAAKEKLTTEMEFLKADQQKRQDLEEELEEVKEIKERLATEIATLKNQQQTVKTEKDCFEEKTKEDAEKATLEAQKAKEETVALEKTVQKQQYRIHKLKEQNRRLSLSMPKGNRDDFYRRLGPLNFKSAFVTGADDNFVGTELVRTLRGHGVDQVVVYVKSDTNPVILHSLGAITARGDLENVQDLAAAMSGCEIVFHCVYTDTGTDFTSMASINVNTTTNVLSAARLAQCKRLVYLSTAEVIVGNSSGTQAADENLRIRVEATDGNFGKSMAMAEQVIQKSTPSKTPLETVIIRAPWIWGKGDKRMKQVMDTIKSNTFTWVNGGTYLYSSCNVYNAVEGLIMGAQNGENGEVYFVADGYPMQFRDFITRVCATQNIDCSHVTSVSTWLGSAVSWFQRASGVSLSYAEIALATAMSRSILVSDKKARSKLGYIGLINFEKGLDEIREEFIMQLKTPRTEGNRKLPLKK